MPTKSNIELGSGMLYFAGVDEPVEVRECEIECRDEEFAEDVQYIRKLFEEPVEFTCESVEFNKSWTTVKCCECDYEFPVTELYALLNGTTGWRCPRCALKAALEDAKKRSNV